MLNTTFPAWPSFSEAEADAVRRVLLSNRVNYWTGDETRNFEAEFGEYIGTDYAIALANGTLALELALRALDIGVGDEVVVTPRSFIASISSVVSVGAKPVFADVDLDSQNLSAATILPTITNNTKAIVIVHLAGMPADMDPIMALAEKHNLFVIEDCAQAHGATYKGRPVGSIGHIGAWSFCQDKIMTTGGEGGAVTTNNKKLWSKMWSYKDHGKSWEAVYETEHPPGFRWLHESFGTNWRMTELQGVLGRMQTALMPEWSAARLVNASKLWEACRAYDWLRVPEVPDHVQHAAYRAYVFVRLEKLPEGWDRDRVLQELAACGIPVYTGSCSEVYLEKAFDQDGLKPAERLSNAIELGDTSLAFLVHPTLNQVHIDRVITALETVNRSIKMI